MSQKPTIVSDFPNYRPDIDGLRAVAILLVIAYHAFPLLITGGFIGVDVFFVISGYLISGIILNHLNTGTFSFTDFYIRRIRRIFPALLTVCIACYIAGWFQLMPEDFKQLGKHIASGSIFVSNFTLWGESGYFDQYNKFKPLLHLWSLGIEEQFYLAWPLTLYLAYKWRLNIFFITLSIGLLSFAMNIYMIEHDYIAAFYSPATRLWELLMGSALSYLVINKDFFDISKSATHRLLPNTSMMFIYNFISCLSLLYIVNSAFMIDDGYHFPGWKALLPTLGAYLLITLGPAPWLHRRFLAHPAMVWLGKISYPLYLWHWPLLSYLNTLYPASPPFSYLFGAIFLSTFLAWITYKYIECPLRFGRQGHLKAVQLAVVMAAIGFIGFVTYLCDGFAFRVPESIRAFAVAIGYPDEEWQKGRCFIDPAKEKFDHTTDCIEKGAKPLVLLWGDSHGASLYPGLKALEAHYNFRIAQFTTSSCPPLLGLDNPKFFNNPIYKYCIFNNNTVISVIQKIHPDIVLLQARWDEQSLDLPKLEFTLDKLKKIDKGRIVLVGPTTRWKYTLSSLAHNLAISDRMQGLIDPSIAEEDDIMSSIAKKEGVEYLSPYKALCNKDGCLMHGTGENSQALVFDTDHLSPQGSRFMMQLLAKDLFPFPTAR